MCAALEGLLCWFKGDLSNEKVKIKPQIRHQDLIFLPAGICLSASATPQKKLLAARAVLCLRDAHRGICSPCWFCSAEKVENLLSSIKQKDATRRAEQELSQAVCCVAVGACGQ